MVARLGSLTLYGQLGADAPSEASHHRQRAPSRLLFATEARRPVWGGPQADAKYPEGPPDRQGARLRRALLVSGPYHQHLAVLVEGFSGMVPADTGFFDTVRHALLQTRHHIILLTPPRARMAPPLYSRALLKASARWRKRIEPVGAQLTERLVIARIRGRDLWHFQHWVIRKVLAHTVCVFLHLQLGRSPMDLDGLVCD